MIRRVVAALLLPLFACSLASAQSLRASVSQVGTPIAPTWQQDYDRALSHRESAKKKIWIGGGAMVGAMLIGLTAGSDGKDCFQSAVNGTKTLTPGETCGGSHAAIALLTGVAGSGVMTWGLIEYSNAKDDIRALESRRPVVKGAVLPITEHQAIGLAIGSSSSRVSYHLSW